MPLQNRVDPFGQLFAVTNKGQWMGNRGRLHDAEKRVIRQFEKKSWITCSLTFGEVKRLGMMQPDSYTELFFLDEATVYAAGHRPCAQCRRNAYSLFKAKWVETFPEQKDLSAKAIDTLLHTARLNHDGSKRTWRLQVGALPDGSMIEHDGRSLLLWQGKQWVWSFAGYQPVEQPLSPSTEVSVITPEPIVRLFANGLPVTVAVDTQVALESSQSVCGHVRGQ